MLPGSDVKLFFVENYFQIRLFRSLIHTVGYDIGAPGRFFKEVFNKNVYSPPKIQKSVPAFKYCFETMNPVPLKFGENLPLDFYPMRIYPSVASDKLILVNRNFLLNI